VAKAKANSRNAEPAAAGGLWHQPTLLNLLADVLTVLGIAGIAWAALTALQRLPVFPLREVVLAETPQRISAEQIAHVARTAVVGNFFTVDLEAARTAIEKLPWVRSAAVRRLWPDGLSLTIEEHEAVAQWRHLNGEPGLVNKQGEVFVADLPDNATALPRFSGPESSSAEILARHGEFEARLDDLGRHVAAVSLSQRRAWRLKLDDGTSLDLGRDEEQRALAERLDRFTAHYAGIKQRFGSVRGIDMRYPNGFTLAGIERVAPPAKPAAGQKS
jgi:cell division protein FtsQ